MNHYSDFLNKLSSRNLTEITQLIICITRETEAVGAENEKVNEESHMTRECKESESFRRECEKAGIL
jgi:hypothetical protein